MADAAWRDAARLKEAESGTARDDAGAPSARLDRGWHGFSEEGQPFRWSHAAVLWAGGQAGELPDCSHISVATGPASLPVRYQLYLPEVWANDRSGVEKQEFRKMSRCRKPE